MAILPNQGLCSNPFILSPFCAKQIQCCCTAVLTPRLDFVGHAPTLSTTSSIPPHRHCFQPAGMAAFSAHLWQPGPSALPRLSCKVFEELAFSNLFLHLQWLHYSEYLVYKGCTLKVTSLAQTCRLRQSDIQMVLGSKSHNSKGKKSLTGVKDVVSVLILPPQSAP